VLQEDEVQTLIDLGLTKRQARVILALARFEYSTAYPLAKASKLPRQDVYRVLDELLELGLIEKEIGSPTKFFSLPIQDVCSLLLNRRVENISDLRIRTKILIRNLREPSNKLGDNEKFKVQIIPEGDAFVLKIMKSIDRAQKSVDAIASSKALPQGLFFLADALGKATHRGARVRILTDKIDESEFNTFSPFLNGKDFETRIISNHSDIRFCVYDKQEVTVVLSSERDFGKSCLLWSDCSSLARTYQDHFDMMWAAAEPFHQVKRGISTRNKKLLANQC
jgi:sugar-specific transcriptional regulator TrmB